MISTLTHTRRPLSIKLARPFMVWWLRVAIRDAQRYADHALIGGVLKPEEVGRLLANITPLRVRLALWERA